MIEKLEKLYPGQAREVAQQIERIIEKYQSQKKQTVAKGLTQQDSMVITYGDSLFEKGRRPLQTLADFLEQKIGGAIRTVHILPFYPYSSDDGFSVIDYKVVDPDLGDWPDIERIATHHELMMDGVINHISQKSSWFQGYLQGQEQYADYFIESDPKLDYSQVVRPRALPLLSEFEVDGQPKHIWTTFSRDQIDLNYRNPKVLLEVIEVLLWYCQEGARFIRLDAIGFAWKEVGTSCIHHPNTHRLIQLIRQVLTSVYPSVIIITETNVPHHENISYFGDGFNEAHMVYQFPLPPLVLHTLLSGDSRKIAKWASGLNRSSDQTTFFNFLASHDGIGLRPVEHLLTAAEIEYLVQTVKLNGGLVSYKDNGDGTVSPYELNVNYMDALGVNQIDESMLILKFKAATGILLSMIGVPALYIHSLLGSGNDYSGVEKSGINRRINRQKLDYNVLQAELLSSHRRRQVFADNIELLTIRQQQPAFHPFGYQEIIDSDSALLKIRRISPDQSQVIEAIINVTDQMQECKATGFDLITNQKVVNQLKLEPYQVVWLKQ